MKENDVERRENVSSHQLLIETVSASHVTGEPRWTVVKSCSCGEWATLTGYASKHAALGAAHANQRIHADAVLALLNGTAK